MKRYPTPNLEKRAGVLDRRLEAVLIDGLLVGVAVGLLGFLAGAVIGGDAVSGFGGAYLAMMFLSAPAILVYQTVLEGYYGMTVGKYLRGIVVVKEDGSPMTWGSAVIRNLLRIVDMLPSFYIVGVVVAYITDKHQRVGDLLGGTVVVYAQD